MTDEELHRAEIADTAWGQGSLLALIGEAETARDEALAVVTEHADPTDIEVIDQAILAFAATGKAFSCNDFRDLLPAVKNRALIGARVRSLAMRKPAPFVRIGEVVSTDPGTHAKKIGLYRLYNLYGETA